MGLLSEGENFLGGEGSVVYSGMSEDVWNVVIPSEK